MWLSPEKHSKACLLLAVSALTAVVGCGTGDYEHLMNVQISKVRSEAPFRALWAPTELPETPIKLRVPIIFKNSYLPNSAHPDDGARINPQRLQPPFLELPGFKLCYEGSVKQGYATEQPYYCYLAALPAKPGDAAKLEVSLQEQLKAKFPETPDAWEDVNPVTPDGKALPWKKLRLVADQPFFIKSGDMLVPTPMPATFELWMFEAPDYVVLVGWRAPKAIDGPTVQGPTAVGMPAPKRAPLPTKPDLNSMPAIVAGSLTTDGAAAPAAEGGG